MKKLIQICLVAIFVFVLFQVVAGTAATAAGRPDLAASPYSSTSNVSAEGAHVSACLVQIKGVVCVRPMVGWNS